MTTPRPLLLDAAARAARRRRWWRALTITLRISAPRRHRRRQAAPPPVASYITIHNIDGLWYWRLHSWHAGNLSVLTGNSYTRRDNARRGARRRFPDAVMP